MVVAALLVGPVRSQPDIPEGDITEAVGAVGMGDTRMEATTMGGITMAAMAGTITEAMHPGVPYSELFSADSLSEASTVPSGGLFTRYPYPRAITIPITNIPIPRLPT